MLFPWESDLLMISESGYITEVEVKISLSDWKADAKKNKFIGTQRQTFDKYIKSFYYAVPAELVLKAPEIPAFAGILAYKDGYYSVAREAAARKVLGIPPGFRKRLQRATYCKYIRTLLLGSSMAFPELTDPDF